MTKGNYYAQGAKFTGEDVAIAYSTGAEETRSLARSGHSPDEQTIARMAEAYVRSVWTTRPDLPGHVRWMDRNLGWMLVVLVLGATLGVCLSR